MSESPTAATPTAAEKAAQTYPRDQLLAAATTYSEDLGRRVRRSTVVGALALLDSEAPRGKGPAELSRKDMLAAIKRYLGRPDPTGASAEEEAS